MKNVPSILFLFGSKETVAEYEKLINDLTKSGVHVGTDVIEKRHGDPENERHYIPPERDLSQKQKQQRPLAIYYDANFQWTGILASHSGVYPFTKDIRFEDIERKVVKEIIT